MIRLSVTRNVKQPIGELVKCILFCLSVFKIERIGGVIFLILMTCSFSANANIVSINAVSKNNQVSISRSSLVQIDWNIGVAANNPGLLSVRSINGSFLAPNRETQLGTSAAMLIQSRSLGEGERASLLIREQLVVPQTVVRRAQQLGFSQILFLRTFTDTPDNSTATALVLLDITSASGSGQITVERVQMRFSNGKVVTSHQSGSKLEAKALLRYSGSGLLEYTWEIASPPSTQGQAFFTPLLSRKQFVLAGSEITLNSPQLPDSRAGDYLVRLRIDKPNPGFELPVLRYTVNSKSSQQPKEMFVSSPPQDAVLTASTEFSWQPIVGAVVYQVEIFVKQPNGIEITNFNAERPITGVQIPANTQALSFKPVSLSHLTRGENYFWRVVAVDQNGKVLAISQSRRLLH